MDQKTLELELQKISTQQLQWHDDFLLKQEDRKKLDVQWRWQRFIWITTAITYIVVQSNLIVYIISLFK